MYINEQILVCTLISVLIRHIDYSSNDLDSSEAKRSKQTELVILLLVRLYGTALSLIYLSRTNNDQIIYKLVRNVISYFFLFILRISSTLTS